jgi:hypothetical protein
MTTALIILGMIAALWSGFFMGYYRREGKVPGIPLPHVPMPAKKGKSDKEDEKANSFFN